MSASIVAGVDEAGRGPLAGPVYAAAVVFHDNYQLEGLTDSKKLTEKKRLELAKRIREEAKSYCVASASVEEIDTMNILQATFLAMQRAVEGLSIAIEEVWIDGNRCPKLNVPSQAIVKGDALIPMISAASILAKCARDAEMYHLDELYPQYQFAKHKGYGTQLHLELIQQHGICAVHRKSFAPIKCHIRHDY